MPADDKAYGKRVRKTKQARSAGNNVSEEFRKRCRINLCITNVDRKDLDAGKVREVYTLTDRTGVQGMEIPGNLNSKRKKVNSLKIRCLYS
jgi:hypothetical protein